MCCFESKFQILSCDLNLNPKTRKRHETDIGYDSALLLVYVQASDRFNINSQLEHLQAKYVGTGHADLNRL